MERRSQKRLEIYATTVCRVPASPCQALIVDISQGGCRLRILNQSFKPGTTVHLGADGGHPFTGEIVWVGDSVAGVRFHTPLTAEAARALGLHRTGEGDRGIPASQDAVAIEAPQANRLRRRLQGMSGG